MPAKVITAELRADISKFETSIAQAQTIVKGLDRTVSQVNGELKKFGNEFGGANLIRQANLAAKAVEDLGGVARLTATEQTKLGRTVDQALEKYRALGQEVPPRLVVISSELQKVREAQEAAERSAKDLAAAQKKAAGDTTDALKEAGGAGGLLASSLKSIGPTLAATFSVGAVVAFGQEMIALGGEITDTASRLGVGTEEVQQFKFAFEQTGASLEDFGKASDTLATKLASGDRSAVAGLTKLGLSTKELLALDPAERFTQVAEAIKGVGSAAEQTDLTKDLLGTTKVLPAIQAGLTDLRQQAKDLGQVIRADDVAALDEFGDLVGTITTQVKVELVTAFFDVRSVVSEITGELSGLSAGVASIVPASLLAGLKDPAVQRTLELMGRLRDVAINPVGGTVKAGLGFLRDRRDDQDEANRPEVELEQLHAQAAALAQSFQGGIKPVDDYIARVKILEADLTRLTKAEKAQIAAAAQLSDVTKEDLVNALNAQHDGLQLTVAAVDLYNKKLQESDQATKKATEDALRLAAEQQKAGEKFWKEAAENGEKGAALAAAWMKDQIKLAETGAKTVLGTIQEETKARENADRIRRRLTQSTVQFEIGEIQRGLDKEIRSIEVRQLTAERAASAIAGAREQATAQIEAEIVKTQEFKTVLYEVLAVMGQIHPELLNIEKGATQVEKAIDWTDSITGLGQAFANLAQIGGDSFGGIAKAIGEVIGLMGVGAQAGKAFGEQFRNKDAKGNIIPMGQAGSGFNLSSFQTTRPDGSQGYSVASVAAGAAQAAPAAVAAYGALDQATNVKGRGNRAARGALTGASIGGQIAGPYGALAGLAVGALVGALRNPAFEDVYNRVAKNFGVKLSDETAKAIAKIAKTDFKGDRAAAEIFSLDTIIGEGGGLKDSNISQLTKRLRDAFSMKDVGKFSADQLTDVLNKNFGAFADFVGRSTTIAGKGFADIARLAKSAGVEVESINQFVSGQTARVGGGLEALSGPLFESAGLGAQVKAAEQAQIDAAKRAEAARGGKADSELGVADREVVAQAETERAAAASDLAALNEKLAAGTKDAQGEFDRLGIIAVGAFNAARASGLGFLEATDQLSPGLDRLVAIQDQLGLSGNAAFGELLKFRDLVSTNETVVASAEALNETILGLSNIGGLTVDTLAALEGQGLATFDKLTAAGFSSGQAIEIQRGFLENLKLAHEQLKVPVDANTQALFDQADALAGLKPKDQLTVMETGFASVVTAVDRLTVALGGEVPAAAAAAGASIAGLATTTETELGGRAGAAITGCFGPLGTDVPAALEVAEGSVIDLADTLEGRIGGGCVSTVDELRKRFANGIPEAAQIAGGAVGAMTDDMKRNLDTQAKESAEEFAKLLGLGIPDATNDAKDGVKDLAGATQVWLEAGSKELKDLISKFRTQLPEAATEAGRIIRDRIPRRIPVDIDVTYNERGGSPDVGGLTGPADATPNAATGAIVFPRPGGTRVNVAEAGQAEVIAPLNRLADILPSTARGGAPIVVHVVGTVEGQPLLRFVARGMRDYTRTFGGLA